MTDGRKRFKKHVTAAKEWLGRAEHSLDEKNDIKGDLNLMLAQAEMQRARETKYPKKSHMWIVRLTPAVLAAVIVFGGMGLLKEQERPVVQPIRTIAEQEASVRDAAAAVVVKETPAVKPQKRIESAEKKMQPIEETSVQQTVPAVVNNREIEPEKVVQKVDVPPENMQKLMRAAGKTLRAQ